MMNEFATTQARYYRDGIYLLFGDVAFAETSYDDAMEMADDCLRRANAYDEAVELLRRLLRHFDDEAPDTFSEDGQNARAFLDKVGTP